MLNITFLEYDGFHSTSLDSCKWHWEMLRRDRYSESLDEQEMDSDGLDWEGW